MRLFTPQVGLLGGPVNFDGCSSYASVSQLAPMTTTRPLQKATSNRVEIRISQPHYYRFIISGVWPQNQRPDLPPWKWVPRCQWPCDCFHSRLFRRSTSVWRQDGRQHDRGLQPSLSGRGGKGAWLFISMMIIDGMGKSIVSVCISTKPVQWQPLTALSTGAYRASIICPA